MRASAALFTQPRLYARKIQMHLLGAGQGAHGSRGESGARTCPCPARRLRSALRRERPLRPRVPTPHSSLSGEVEGRHRGPRTHPCICTSLVRVYGTTGGTRFEAHFAAAVRWRPMASAPVEYLFRYFEEAAAPPAPSRLVSVAIRAPAGLVAVADRRCARGVRPLY
eukprot:scaffold4113_cov46-Phaeocystis_antarctica.AAC.1